MKVRNLFLAALVAVSALGLTTQSMGVAEAASLAPTAIVQELATPTAVLAPARIAPHAVVIPSAIRTFGRCVINHESRTAGLYRAQNPWSTASGAYQFTNGTWRHYARLAGYGHRYSRARYAPPHVQDAVFAYAIRHHAFYHWKGTHCGHGT